MLFEFMFTNAREPNKQNKLIKRGQMVIGDYLIF